MGELAALRRRLLYDRVDHIDDEIRRLEQERTRIIDRIVDLEEGDDG